MEEEESDNSSCDSDHQDWESPTKDIDLTASEDILGDEEDGNDSDQLHYSQTSSSEGDVSRAILLSRCKALSKECHCSGMAGSIWKDIIASTTSKTSQIVCKEAAISTSILARQL